MSRFRKIDAGTWADRWFVGLSPDAKLLWFYLLTGPEVTSVPGLIVAGRAHLSEALGWDLSRFDVAFSELRPKAHADWVARVVWLPNATRYNEPANPNVVKGWKDALRAVPECELRNLAVSGLETVCESLGQAFAEAFRRVLGKRLPERFEEASPERLSEGSVEWLPIPVLARARAAPAPAPVPVPVSEGVQGEAGHGLRPMPADLKLTDEDRAYAEMLPVSDVDDEWAKFVAHQRSKGNVSADWSASWRKWSHDAKKFQSRDRARRGHEPEPEPEPTPKPKARTPDVELTDEQRAANARELGKILGNLRSQKP